MSSQLPGTGRKRVHPLVIVALAVLSLVAGLVLAVRSRPDGPDVRAAVDATAVELRRTPVDGLTVDVSDVRAAATRANPASGTGKFARDIASELRIESAGEGSRGDLFEITNSVGEHPVCLAVKVDGNLGSPDPVFPSASVTDGPC